MAVINIEVNGKKILKEVPDNTLLSDFLVSNFERNTASTKDGRSITADVFCGPRELLAQHG